MLFDRLGSMAMVTEDKEACGRRLNLLASFVAGEACSIYATFFAHAVTPATVYVVNRYTHRRLLFGQIGDIEEVFNWGRFGSHLGIFARRVHFDLVHHARNC